MATKLTVDGSTGVVMIADSTVPLVTGASVYSYLNNITFHTDLPYLQIISTVSNVTLTLSGLTRDTITWTDGGGCC